MRIEAGLSEDAKRFQGQKISVSEGVKQHYSLKVPPGQEHLPWKTQIVMSTLPAEQLPSSLNKPGVRGMCKVKSRLPPDMKMKNRHWYNAGSQYLKAEFDMQVIIGPADLKFQTLSSKDGVLSQTHDNIDVEWSSNEKEASHPLVAELEGSGLLENARQSHKFRVLSLNR